MTASFAFGASYALKGHSDSNLRPDAAELYKWSSKFQRRLDKLCSQHSSHLELLRMLACSGEGALGAHSLGLHGGGCSVPLARADGDVSGPLVADIFFGFGWDDDDDDDARAAHDNLQPVTLAKKRGAPPSLKASPSSPKVGHHDREPTPRREAAAPSHHSPMWGQAGPVAVQRAVGDSGSDRDGGFPTLHEEHAETHDSEAHVTQEKPLTMAQMTQEDMDRLQTTQLTTLSSECSEVLAHRLWTRELGVRRWTSQNLEVSAVPSGRHGDKAFAGSVRQSGSWAGRLCVVRPGSVRHLVHAIISLAVILYDLMSLPLTAAFQLDSSLVLYHMDLAACCFWSFDVVMNFLTGYNDSDCIEMRFRAIAKRYLKTWFTFDIMVIGFDWITILMNDMPGLGFARTFKAPRFVRMFFRTLRLLRLVKLVSVLEDIVNSVVSEWMNNTIGIAKMLFGIVLFNHFVACGWYAVGVSGARPNWVEELDQEASSTLHRYVVSFHWSMCQYTPAPNNYHPRNFYERLYACVTLLFGMAVFTAFLGKITSLLTHMSATAFARSRDERSMRQYFATNMITMDAVNRVNSFLKNRSRAKRVIPFGEVSNFKGLPKTLALELKFQAHLPCLTSHAMFAHIDSIRRHRHLVFRLCSRAVTEVGLKWGDELLNAGSPALQTVFVKHGTLQYVNQVVADTVAKAVSSTGTESTTTASSGGVVSTPVGPGCSHLWACEMALWCQWAYRGHLRAVGEVIVLVIEVAAFHALVLGEPGAFSELKKYAEVYVDSLHEASRESSSGVDDLWGGPYQVEHMTEEAFCVRSESRRDTRRGANLGLANLTLGLKSRLGSRRRPA